VTLAPPNDPGTRARILVLDPIDDAALRVLAAGHTVETRYAPPPQELPSLAAGADVIVVRSGSKLTAEVIEAAGSLRAIVRAGAGTDNIDLDAARRAGVIVCNIPGGSANAVAELALGLTFSVARKIALADRQLRANQWNKPALAGVELHGRTLGVVGHGNIGARLAQLGTALGMTVLTSVARPDEERRAALAADGIRLTGLPELLAASDVVCLAVPLDDRTRGLIGAAELRAMRPTAILVNVSRGGVVDEEVLRSALVEGVIAGAGVDVFSAERVRTPLADLDNVVLTPHLGAMSTDAQRLIGERVVDAVTAALTGGTVANRVC
jgi:D-3-phosphoglycerate dehydrogenase / 2-oxoglutarate reductase